MKIDWEKVITKAYEEPPPEPGKGNFSLDKQGNIVWGEKTPRPVKQPVTWAACFRWNGGLAYQYYEYIKTTKDMTLLPVLSAILRRSGVTNAEILDNMKDPNLGWDTVVGIIAGCPELSSAE